MIKKIKRINNFAVFNNFHWDSSVIGADGQPITFKKINIIYGRNYSGKTTLSRIMQSLETQVLPEKYDNPQFELLLDDNRVINQSSLSKHNLDVRVFNKNFMRTNLSFLIDPDGEIEPFAILGANNTEIEKVIKELELEIGSNIETQETGLYKMLKDEIKAAQKAKSTYSAANNALENKLSNKATLNRQTSIKYNADRFGDQNYTITKIKQDINVITSKDYTNLTVQQKTEHENMIRENTKPLIPKIPIPTLQIDNFCNKAEALLSRKIGSSNKIAELLADAALNEWVKKGKVLQEGKSICSFCGNTISDKRWQEINAHFDEESKKLEAEIDVLLSEIKAEKDKLQKPLGVDKTLFYTKFSDSVNAFINAVTEAIQDYCSTLDNIINQLEARKSQITITTHFIKPTDNSAVLIKLFEDYEHIRRQNYAFSSKLGKEKIAAQKALRLQEVADFCATIGYISEMANISALKTKSDTAEKVAKNTENLLKTKKQELQVKLRELNDEEEGAKRVNQYLNDYFGHNFVTLEAEKVTEGEKRIRFRIMRNEKPAFNMSEGECSLISFCYFMAKLDDIDTSGKKPIIWIDDPISSLDSNHVFFAYTLLRTVIVETGKYEQLFVSTHNLDFLKYLKRLTGSDNDKKVKYFIVQRNDTISLLKPMPQYLQKYVTEFNYLFHEIYKCSTMDIVDDSNYTNFYNFGNNARKFLEILMFYYYPDETTHLYKLEMFFGAGRVPAVLTDRINNEYSHLCGTFERGEVPTEVPEMLKTSKLIIETLKIKNLEQYNALLNSIGEVENVAFPQIGE